MTKSKSWLASAARIIPATLTKPTGQERMIDCSRLRLGKRTPIGYSPKGASVPIAIAAGIATGAKFTMMARQKRKSHEARPQLRLQQTQRSPSRAYTPFLQVRLRVPMSSSVVPTGKAGSRVLGTRRSGAGGETTGASGKGVRGRGLARSRYALAH
jgi:hypothetical protein